MAARKPTVIGSDGLLQQLQAGDTVVGPNAFFTGTGQLPSLTALVLSGKSTLTVSPTIAGDVLAKGECITVTPGSALPAGLNIAYAIVTAGNTVEIGFSAGVAISASSMFWTVCAHR